MAKTTKKSVPKSRRRHDAASKLAAVKRVLAGEGLKVVAKKIKVNPTLLSRWKGELAGSGAKGKPAKAKAAKSTAKKPATKVKAKAKKGAATKRRRHDAAFKLAAVNRVLAGEGLKVVARKIKVNPTLLSRWKREITSAGRAKVKPAKAAARKAPAKAKKKAAPKKSPAKAKKKAAPKKSPAKAKKKAAPKKSPAKAKKKAAPKKSPAKAKKKAAPKKRASSRRSAR